MRFELRHAANGVVLRIEYDIGDQAEAEELVYQEAEDESNDVKAFADLLRKFNEHWGPSTSRYAPQRIYISVEPGDKHDDERSLAEDEDPE